MDIRFDRFTRSLSDVLEPPVRKHLKNVYGTFTIAAAAASMGGYVDMFGSFIGAGFLTGIGAIATLVMLMMTPYDGKNQITRLSLLSCFAFLSGVNMGPLLQFAAIVNPALIMQALLGTSVVFACFSLCALYAPRGQYLYLGGILMSGLSTLFWLSIMNIFFGSTLIYQLNLYVGLLIMCGFVIYDTQSIVEKSRRGDNDYVMHSLELFIDFISIFRRLLIILTDKENKEKRKKRN